MTCDTCDLPVLDTDTLVQVRIPRPSNSRDLCCIGEGHAACFGYVPLADLPTQDVPTVLTAEEWDQWIEEHGAKHGHLWLT